MSDAPFAMTTAQASWVKATAVLCLALLLSACASHWRPDETADVHYPPWLLTGERLFDEPIGDGEVPLTDISAPTEEMRAYVSAMLDGVRSNPARFRALFAGLARDGYFRAVYSANQTLTAAETFELRGGNCLSYTNMFIALAREAGLDASYQVVDVPPSWDADSGFLIRYTHVNVLVRGVRLEPGALPSVTVDFNVVHPEDEYRRWPVSDDYAQALFHANHSVSLLREGRTREGFAHLRRGLEVSPGNLDLWINLGAFYATQGDYEASIAAYEVALQLDPDSRAAFSGLARSHGNAGNETLARMYADKERNYRERNPYFHYALAQAAFERADFEASLAHIEDAISLKSRTPKFFLMRALVQERLGQVDAAESSIRRARRLGLEPGVKAEVLRQMGLATI
ncbi:MAG: tetratricopeptide repeat protein [Pseudomonadales bacterium]